MRCLVVLLIVGGFWIQNTLSAATINHAGRLIDGRSDELQTEVSIVVEDGRITKVVPGFLKPAEGDKLINLSAHTAMPGLMDMHTHLMAQHSKESYTEKFFMEESDYALRSTMFARSTLMAGFTTVRDLGDNGINSVSLRKAINEGWIIGPRIYTAGKSIATTGGHADPTNGLKGDYRRDAGPVEGVINGADDARKAVRQRYKDGADLIKLTATGGILSLAASGQNPQFTDEELKAIVETAKDYNMVVTVLAHGAEGMKRAVLAGVNSVEHGTYMTDEITELMKERGTYFFNAQTTAAARSIRGLTSTNRHWDRPDFFRELPAESARGRTGRASDRQPFQSGHTSQHAQRYESAADCRRCQKGLRGHCESGSWDRCTWDSVQFPELQSEH